MAELREYARASEKPLDSNSVEFVISYLEALNKLFEKSIIGQKVRVFDVEGTTIQRMSEGFKFFADWANENKQGDIDNKAFLAWQVINALMV